ncbi:MAG: hypothetical protein ABFD60_15205 [Bryobacteraceae bacterium]
MPNNDEKDQFELILEDSDAPEASGTVEKASEPEEDPKLAIAELNRKLREANARAQEAEKAAREQYERQLAARAEVEDTNLHLVNNAIETVKRENEILKANLRDAMASGDYDKVAEAQEAISMNAAKLLQLENGREAMKNQPRQPVQPMPRAQDPVEQVKASLSPRSAAWVDQHPEYVRDPRLFRKMVAAHELAVSDGIEPDSDEYFASVERTLGLERRLTEETEVNVVSEASQATQRRAAPAAAPVSRSGTGGGSRPNVVRLTAAEREMAEMMGMSEKDYARNKLALQREGKLN